MRPSWSYAVPADMLEKAQQSMRQSMRELGQFTGMSVIQEIGLEDLLRYDSNGKLHLGAFSDLQVIALAAALRAVVRGGGKRIEAE